VQAQCAENKRSQVNTGSTRGQHRVNPGSTQGPPRVNTWSTRGQHRVNPGSTWDLCTSIALPRRSSLPRLRTHRQGLTLVHFSAQLEPCLSQENTLHNQNTPSHPLNTGETTHTRTPYPIQSAQVELKSGRVLALAHRRRTSIRISASSAAQPLPTHASPALRNTVRCLPYPAHCSSAP
jgi:hypothetical protein